IVQRRWFGARGIHAATMGEMVGDWAKTALAVSITAWVVATPIAMYHFGMIAPLGAPLSIIAVPISAVILAVGYTKMVLAALLRIDMIAVGDGSCYVLRSGGHAMVFDAGSSTDLDAGRRTIIPALRRLGVRSIDAIAVTHADLDHYSAVLEISREFGAGEVLMTPQFLQEAREQPF